MARTPRSAVTFPPAPRASPVDRHPQEASLSVAIEQVAALPAEEKELRRDLHILAAVTLDQIEPPLAKPAEALESISSLARSEVGFSDVSEPDTEAEPPADETEHVQGTDPVEVVRGVGGEDRNVEPVDVETDHLVRRHQVEKEAVHFPLPVRAELVAGRLVHDRKGPAHRRDASPASDFLGAALGLDVKKKEPAVFRAREGGADRQGLGGGRHSNDAP